MNDHDSETNPSISERRGWPDFPVTGAWQPGDPSGAREFLDLPRSLALEGGGVIESVTLAYETWGARSTRKPPTPF